MIVNFQEEQFFIIPRGVEHLPVAEEECYVLLFEPKSVVDTGNNQGKKQWKTLKEYNKELIKINIERSL